MQARGDPAQLARAARRAEPTSLAGERTLPVLPALATLLPGLQRGSVIGIEPGGEHRHEPGGEHRHEPVSGGHVAGVTSLALALAAEASQAGSWTAVVGLRALGLAAAAEAGIVLGRLVLVARPEPREWGPVVATLADAIDVVLLDLPARVPAGDARRLAARARERGTVLVVVDPPAASPFAIDVHLRVVGVEWTGLGEGYGHLQARRVHVVAEGRRAAARARRAVLWLPGPYGAITLAEPSMPAEPIVEPIEPMVEPVALRGVG